MENLGMTKKRSLSGNGSAARRQVETTAGVAIAFMSAVVQPTSALAQSRRSQCPLLTDSVEKLALEKCAMG
jgi:hypothetical protein